MDHSPPSSSPPGSQTPHGIRGAGGRTPAEAPQHAVQFYEDERFLCAVVGRYIAGALHAGHPAIVIATAAHRELIVAELFAHGVDLVRARRTDLLTLLDAHEMLGTFMVGDRPDPIRFRRTAGGLLERLTRGRPDAIVHTYGEMVDLLWRQDNPEAALQVEEIWNEFAVTRTLSTLCGYAIGHFREVRHGLAFLDICRCHTHVLPTEHYLDAPDEEARLREVSRLQQRSHALETELDRRKELERVLRAIVECARAAADPRADGLAARRALSLIERYAARHLQARAAQPPDTRRGG